MKEYVKRTIHTILRIFNRLPFSLTRKSAQRGGQNASAARHIKNIKKFMLVAGTVAVAAIVVVVLVGGKQTAPEKDPMAATDNTVAQPGEEPAAATVSASKFSLAMPVSAPLSISEGTDAAVVKDIQLRLIELGYLEADEPGTVYRETTRIAVEHFQTQSGLDATGTVDQQTYDLLASDQAQYYIITIGAEGTNISELQQRLYELGYMDTVTGYFGTETETAVTKFQKLNELTEDGKVDKNTHEMLYADNASPNMYSYGEQSPEILSCQQRLRELGYLTTEPDGTFGEDTKAAVRRFQESNSIVVDGFIGPTTQAALMSDTAQANALAIGAKGDDVTNVQKRLKALGYMSNVTGYYGEETDGAVRNFQKANGLTADGKIGKQTMNTLTSSSAKKYQAPVSSRSSSSSGSSRSDSSASSATVTGANVESLIAVAESKLGCKYAYGSKGPDTFDCSGFVYWCLSQVGVSQGYMTSASWATSTKYTRISSMSDVQRGDIIVYSGHVAIYAGNGAVIDASSSNGKVVRRGCTSPWFTRNFICAYRVF